MRRKLPFPRTLFPTRSKGPMFSCFIKFDKQPCCNQRGVAELAYMQEKPEHGVTYI